MHIIQWRYSFVLTSPPPLSLTLCRWVIAQSACLTYSWSWPLCGPRRNTSRDPWLWRNSWWPSCPRRTASWGRTWARYQWTRHAPWHCQGLLRRLHKLHRPRCIELHMKALLHSRVAKCMHCAKLCSDCSYFWNTTPTQVSRRVFPMSRTWSI